MPHPNKKDVNTGMEYYVLYKDKPELEETFKNSGKSSVEKYYDLNKFKYQEPGRDEETK